MKKTTEKVEIRTYNLEPIPRVINAGAGDNILVSVTIANGQTGWTAITKDGEAIKSGVKIVKQLLGIATSLANKEIKIDTNFTTINPHEPKKCRLITQFQNQAGNDLGRFIDDHDASKDGYAKFIAKYKILTILPILFFQSAIFAQNNEVPISSLETPTSPGFALLDNTPESVDRPTTPQGLAATVLGAANGTNWAVEVAPYWLTYHNVTAEDMVANHFPFKHFFSFSAASVKEETSTYLTGGIRSRLYQRQNKARASAATGLITEIGTLSIDPEGNNEAIRQKKKEYQELLLNPTFSLDFAVAVAGGALDNTFDNLSFARWGGWLSGNLNFEDATINLLGRYISNEEVEAMPVACDLIDVGGKFSYEFGRLNLGLEYVQRFNQTVEVEDDYRIAGIGKYQIMENIYLTASIGKNFTDVNNLIALGGLSIGYSKN